MNARFMWGFSKTGERISVRVGGHCRERPHTKTLLIPIDYWCTTAWHSIHRQLLIGAFCVCGVNPLPACWQCPLFDWGHSGLAGSGEIEGVRTDRFSPQVWVVVGSFLRRSVVGDKWKQTWQKIKKTTGFDRCRHTKRHSSIKSCYSALWRMGRGLVWIFTGSIDLGDHCQFPVILRQ